MRINTNFLVLVLLMDLKNPALGLEPVTGEISVHDPSTIVTCNGEHWLFATGRGINTRHSKDLVNWSEGPRVFSASPAWTTNLVPGFRGYIWAPDVSYFGGKYFLYYSVSTWGSQTSAIGLVTNPNLNPDDPAYSWTDCGVVISSSARLDFNAIDPATLLDSG